ncbi:MAG: hypothetical protein ACYC3G_04315 [Minisyncoccota bacterium]
MNNVAVSPEPVELDLVIVPLGFLGFSRSVRYGEVCTIGAGFDFELCPEDTVLGLLQEVYKDQPDGQLHIASKGILDSDGDECIFVIIFDKEGLALHVTHGNPDRFLSPDSQLVFVKDKRVLSGKVSVN